MYPEVCALQLESSLLCAKACSFHPLSDPLSFPLQFSAFVDKGIVDDLHGFYNPKTQTFSTVISLGR